MELVSSTSELREKTTDLHAQNPTILSPSTRKLKAPCREGSAGLRDQGGNESDMLVLTCVTVSLESCQSPWFNIGMGEAAAMCWADGILALVFLATL